MDLTGDDPQDATLRAYERGADRYVAVTTTARSPLVDELIALVPPGAHVLELGSGPGRDALALEAAGLRVDRTDGAPAFAARLPGARVMDVRADDFGGPYDAVFANSVLLHVARSSLRGVLSVARRAVVPGGVVVASFKSGVGEGWSHAKLDDPRHFTFWGADPLAGEFAGAGWDSVRVWDSTGPASVDQWLSVTARNPTSV